MAIMVRDKDFYKTLVKLSVPIALQNFITFGVAFAANIMVGSLGEYAISGVFMANQIQTFLQFYVGGMDGALLVLAAQYWGKRDSASIIKLIAISVRLSLLGGAVLTACVMLFPARILSVFTTDPLIIEQGVQYLRIVCYSYLLFCLSQSLISAMRSVENVRIGLCVSITALVTSIVLNYVFIFGKLGFEAMGITGAARATLISRILELIVIVFYVLKKDRKLRMKIRDFLPFDIQLFRDFLRYGLPILGGQIVWATNLLSQSAIIGRMGADAVASVSITGMLSNLFFVWVMGLGAGVGIITGKSVGAGKIEEVKRYSKTVQAILLVVGVIGAVFIYLMRDAFISLYNLNGDTIVVARQFMLVLAVAMLGRCYQGAGLAGLVKAGGDTGFVFRNDTIFVFLVVLPSALIAMHAFHAPPWVVYACLQSDQLLKCPVAFVKINSYTWIRNLTRTADAQS